MKSCLVFLVFVVLSTAINAFDFNIKGKSGLVVSQHYGVDFGYEDYEVDKGIRIGYSGGFALDFEVNELLTVSQEFIYTNKGSKQQIQIKEQPILLDVFYKQNYLEFPTLLILKYHRKSDFTLFYQTGFSLSFLLGGNYQIEGAIETSQETYDLEVDQKMKNIDQFDMSLILGGGLEYKVFNQLVSLDYRVNFGIPFIDLPTTEDIEIDGEKPFPEPERVKLRNLSYVLNLGWLIK